VQTTVIAQQEEKLPIPMIISNFQKHSIHDTQISRVDTGKVEIDVLHQSSVDTGRRVLRVEQGSCAVSFVRNAFALQPFLSGFA
jgi:hypothetical protein